jgi:hypothetical protein
MKMTLYYVLFLNFLINSATQCAQPKFKQAAAEQSKSHADATSKAAEIAAPAAAVLGQQPPTLSAANISPQDQIAQNIQKAQQQYFQAKKEFDSAQRQIDNKLQELKIELDYEAKKAASDNAELQLNAALSHKNGSSVIIETSSGKKTPVYTVFPFNTMEELHTKISAFCGLNGRFNLYKNKLLLPTQGTVENVLGKYYMGTTLRLFSK